MPSSSQAAAHHPGEEWLWGYAMGALPEAASLLVASHLTFCPACRAAVRDAETIGGAWLGGQEVSLAMATARPSGGGLAQAPAPGAPGGLPRPLLRHAGGGVETLPWRRVGPGIERADLAGPAAGPAAFMLRVAPGAPVPRHSHDGEELTLVLTGAYQDEIGRFAAGDVADLDRATTHRPVAERDAPCVCLVVLEGRLRFSSPLARLVQPFVRF